MTPQFFPPFQKNGYQNGYSVQLILAPLDIAVTTGILQPRSQQPVQMRQLCVGGSTDLLGQSNLDVCRSFDTLVTGRPLAALYLPSLCLTDKLTHVLLFRAIDVALSAHSVR